MGDICRQIPDEELRAALQIYDKSSPKLDEIAFVNELANRYRLSNDDIIANIRRVRKYDKHKQKDDLD